MVEKTEKNVLGSPANQRVFRKGFKDTCNELRANGTIKKIQDECTKHVLKGGFFFKGALYKEQDTDAETFTWFLEVAREVENDAKVEEENRSAGPTDHIKESEDSFTTFNKTNEAYYNSTTTCKHVASITLACLFGGVTHMANAGPMKTVEASVFAGLGAETIMPDWLMVGGSAVLLGVLTAMSGYRGAAELENTPKAVNTPVVTARGAVLGAVVGTVIGAIGLLEGLVVEKACEAYGDYFNE